MSQSYKEQVEALVPQASSLNDFEREERFVFREGYADARCDATHIAGDADAALTTAREERDALRAHVEQLRRAVEFGGFLATTGDRLIEALNAEDELRVRREESDDVSEDDIYDAGETRAEYVQSLRRDIYEFRKRVPVDAAIASA